MNRIFVISVIAAVAALLGYVFISQGPPRVHAVTVLVQLPYLVSIAGAAWVLNVNRQARLLLVLALIVAFSFAGTYLDSLVIRALTPLHPIHFVTGFIGFLGETLLFLALIRVIDGVFDLVARMRKVTPGS